MASVSVISDQGGVVLYEVAKSNWANPKVLTFDERVEVPLSLDSIIDVILLGDGFLVNDQTRFENHLSDWYDQVFSIWPYSQFKGAFRVRGVFTPSANRVTSTGDSYFGVKLKVVTDKNGIQRDSNDVRRDSVRNNTRFCQILYDVLQFVNENGGFNSRIYPSDLDIGTSGDDSTKAGLKPTGFERSIYQSLYRNCIVSVGVLNQDGSTRVGGFLDIASSPDDHPRAFNGNVKVGVAVAADHHHEFSHAFALLADEYIHVRGSFSNGQQPSHRSVFDLYNLAFTRIGEQLPWHHLSWNGRFKRSPDSLVGQMWLGGRGTEKGVCHSEYMCLMNGYHKNYFYSTDEPDQEITLPSGDLRPVWADLRAQDRFCLWCEELVTIKILEKTDALLRFEDLLESKGDINTLGQIWHNRWVNELRDVYWQQFDLDTKIADREQLYSAMTMPKNITPGFGGALLSTSKLMIRVEARTPSANVLQMLMEDG